MKSKRKTTFNAQAFLDSSGIARKIVEFRRSEAIYAQGDACDNVMYIRRAA